MLGFFAFEVTSGLIHLVEREPEFNSLRGLPAFKKVLEAAKKRT